MDIVTNPNPIAAAERWAALMRRFDLDDARADADEIRVLEHSLSRTKRKMTRWAIENRIDILRQSIKKLTSARPTAMIEHPDLSEHSESPERPKIDGMAAGGQAAKE